MGRVILALVLAATWAPGCVRRRPFRCDDDSQCINGEANGFCQPTGYCSYLDLGCPLELRYEQNAGDGFGGACVDEERDDEITCQVFCDFFISVCGDTEIYEASDDCQGQCSQWPTEGGGDSLDCRVTQVGMAEESGNLEPCFGASPGGDGVCVHNEQPTCDGYCDAYLQVCPLWAYDSFDECLAVCANIYPGYPDNVVGDSLACRIDHLNATELEIEQRCNIAGPGSNPPCVVG